MIFGFSSLEILLGKSRRNTKPSSDVIGNGDVKDLGSEERSLREI